MKRILAFLTAFTLLFGCACAEPAEILDAVDTVLYRLEMRKYPWYINRISDLYDGDQALPLWFVNRVDDLPFMDLQDWADLLNLAFSDERQAAPYWMTFQVDEEENQVILTRENGQNAIFDFTEHTIVFSDYVDVAGGQTDSYIDVTAASRIAEDGGMTLIAVTDSRDRYGEITTLNLADYGIPMIAQDGQYLVPLETLSTFFLNPAMYGMYFNSEAAFLVPINLMESTTEDGEPITDPESLYVVYNAPGKTERSETLVEYCYAELCLELDCFYGLKDAHSIPDFNMFFLQTGLADGLGDTDAAKADSALADLLTYWFDDSHSGFISASWMSKADPERTYGYSRRSIDQFEDTARAVRSEYPGADQPYYETGDTAFVTFDDTISLIIDAHRQITRENSPIRNVVLDLSCNGGGTAAAAAYVLCWFLGEAQLSIHNTFTGAQSTATYRADVNLDHISDEQDTLAGRGLNLFCLTSPASFSCGNLVPWAFKENGSVTLLGKTSGGGSCIVMPMTTAWGTSYQISGCERMAFVKNGSYYDVDRGVDPDFPIRDLRYFYDREELAEYIRSLR